MNPTVATLAMLLGLSLAMTGCGQSAGGVDIWDAVARDDALAIQKFASAGGDLNVRGSGGSTPLWVALKEKNRYSYEALLKNGADPNVIMSGRRVVTHWAASEQDPWWLCLALEHGADPNLVNVGRGRPSEGTPLQFALSKRSMLIPIDAKFLDNVKLLVEHGADIDKPWPASPGESPNGPIVPSYPLAEAANCNDFEGVLYLLEAGADYKLAEYGGISFLARIRDVGEWMEEEEHPIQQLVDRKKFDAVRAWLQKRGGDVGGK
ncbi:MAG: ankyrin repeat domain-containing protein [Pirellulales bacterium]